MNNTNFSAGKRYQSIGRCIYCGRSNYADGDDRELGDEHIIPESLNGKLVFSNASCRSCEELTGKIENIVCHQHLIAPRWSMGLKSKRPLKKRARLIPLFSLEEKHERRIDVDIDDFPSVLLLFSLGEPPLLRALYGLPPESHDEVKPWLYWFNYNHENLRTKYGVKNFAATRADLRAFCRMLAKIAHSYAVATLGPLGFTPLLDNIIRDQNLKSREAMRFVGCMPDQTVKENALHSLGNGFATLADGRKFHIVKIRLFAQFGAPTYTVVVGTIKELEIPSPPPEIGDTTARHNYYRITIPASREV